MLDHLKNGDPLPEIWVVRPELRDRAADNLELANLPAIQVDAPDADQIRFQDGQVRIRE